jgi:hypothetical protein
MLEIIQHTPSIAKLKTSYVVPHVPAHPKAPAWAAGLGFHAIQARPKPLLSRRPWPGLAQPISAWLGLAPGLKPGRNSTTRGFLRGMANCAAKKNYELANFILFSQIFISSCSPHLCDSNAGVLHELLRQ